MHSADDDRIAERRARAIKLRVQGKTIREIASELDISVGLAHSDVRAQMAEVASEAAESVEQQRGLELTRLERAFTVIEQVLANAPGLDQGDELTLKALDRMVKLQEQRAKLLGLYSPEKRELSGPNGAAILIDARTELLERLAGIAAGGSTPRAEASGTPEPEPGRDSGGKA